MSESIKQRAAADDLATASSELRNITPDQAETWVENNVNDLATAKMVLKKMARLLAAHDRKIRLLDRQ